MESERPAVLAAPEFQMEKTNMLARNAEPSRPQSFTSLQSSAGEPRHRENFGPVQLGVAVPNATLYRLASVAGVGSALILAGQRGQTQLAHPDHRSNSTSRAVRRDHGARPCHGPVPCVRAARGTVRYCRVCHQLHCIGEFGRRGSGDQSRILEPSGDGYHRAESRAAWDLSYRQFFAFSPWHARVCDLSCRWKRRASHSARALFHWRVCLSRSVHSCRNWLLTWAW